MNFLEARRIVAGFQGGAPLRFLLAMSGASEALDVFLRAAAAHLHRTVEMQTLPYNTLAQMLASENKVCDAEVLLLVPWDFAPECDWRSGLPASRCTPGEVHQRVRETAERIAGRTHARGIFLPAPFLPIFGEPSENGALASAIASHAQGLGAHLLSPDCFALGTYLASGCPVAASRLGEVADVIVGLASSFRKEPCKVLITDFDNVLWQGVIGEDGLTGIACGPQGSGFRHFLYQTLLLKLKSEGTLLFGLSRNDPADAVAPLQSGATLLREEDFVGILASYYPKSAMIRMAASNLNLGLDQFVFVDDSVVELAEVAAALPQVTCIRFPEFEDGLPQFFQELRRLFARPVMTEEDLERTEMYRRRLAGLIPTQAEGADLKAFLEGLGMCLTIHDRSAGTRDRAVQLINKTNQFNINGRRFSDEEVGEVLARGGRLFAASLVDRTGSHGEILACLISVDGIVESFVLSCRVFERRVEHAFIVWLASQQNAPKAFRFATTPRNEPARKFLADPAFAARNGDSVVFDAAAFADRHRSDFELFSLGGP